MKWPRRRKDTRLNRARAAQRAQDAARRSRVWRRRFRRLLHANVIAPAKPRRTGINRPPLGRRLRATLANGVRYVVALLVAAAIPTGGYLLYRHLLTTPHFFVRNIVVAGAERLSVEDIRTAAGLDGPVTTLSIDERAVETALAAHEWIDTAKVEVRLPQTVRIEVRERQPAALLALGETFMVDRHGELFRRVHPDENTDAPLLTGISRVDLTDPARQPAAKRRIREALAGLRAYREAGLEAVAPLSEVHSHPVYGLIARTLDGVEVWLGSGQYSAKMLRLTDVLADAELRGLRVRTVYLDTKDALERVVVRTDKESTGAAPGELVSRR